MAVFVALVAGIAALLSPALYGYFMGNPAVNGVILGILVAGIIYIFRQVMRLNPEVAWIERFRRNQPNLPTETMPRLLSPMATRPATPPAARLALPATSIRTLLAAIRPRLADTLQ